MARRPQVREESHLFLEKLEVLQKGVLDMVEPYPVLSARTEEPWGSSRKKKSGKRVKGQPVQRSTIARIYWHLAGGCSQRRLPVPNWGDHTSCCCQKRAVVLLYRRAGGTCKYSWKGESYEGRLWPVAAVPESGIWNDSGRQIVGSIHRYRNVVRLRLLT